MYSIFEHNKLFIVNFRDTINSISHFIITNEYENSDSYVFRITYTKNTIRNYIVTMKFNIGFVTCNIYSIDNDNGVRGIFETAIITNNENAIKIAKTAMYIIVCDSNQCRILYYNTLYMNTVCDAYDNFKNNFCVIVPLDHDEIPFIIEMHSECNVPIYSVSGAHSDRDFTDMNDALYYFIDKCDFDI